MNSQDLDTLVASAGRAPSVMNTQPWTFSVRDDTIDVRADRQRTLATFDPQGRSLTISCGAAVEFARVTARGLGWECAVHPCPDAADPDLLARLSIGARRPATPDDGALVDAISGRYTDRGPYDPTPIAPSLIDDLVRGVAARDGWFRLLNHPGDRLAVIRALSAAEAAEAADPAYRAELHDWLRAGDAVDGVQIPTASETAQDRVTDVPTRDFTGANVHPRPGGDGPPPAVERDALVMLGTAGDRPSDWINAGRALGWVLLRLTVGKLSSQPLGQAIDIETFRQQLATEIGVIGHVQFLLRVGVGHGRSSTGRRSVSSTRR